MFIIKVFCPYENYPPIQMLASYTIWIPARPLTLYKKLYANHGILDYVRVVALMARKGATRA